MSTVRYNKIDFSALANPTAGNIRVGYDLDGLYKQKDENGIISIIVNELGLKTINSESLIGVGDIIITGGGGGIADITYSSLKALYDGGTMVSGTYYRITDFATIYTRPDFDGAGTPKVAGDLLTITCPVEPIIVLALTTSILSSSAYQETYPNDKIKYDITFDTTDVKGDPAKGRISERIDDLQNRTDYDHRNILFKRYETASASGIFTVINDNSEASDLFPTFTAGFSTRIVFSDFAQFATLVFGALYPILSNNVIQGTALVVNFALAVFNNTFKLDPASAMSDCSFGIQTIGNVFNVDFVASTTGLANMQSNTIGGGPGTFVSNMEFGTNCRDNVLSGTVGGNRFLDSFQNNIVGGNFGNNIIGIGFRDNTIGSSFQYNVILDDFADIIAGNNFQNNDIGSDFESASGIGDDFSHNRIGDNCNITTGNNYQGNTIGNSNNGTFGNDVADNTFGNNNTITTFSNNNHRNTFGNNNTIIFSGDEADNNKFGNFNNINLTGGFCGQNDVGNNNNIIFGIGNYDNILKNSNNVTFGINNLRNSIGSNNTINIADDNIDNSIGNNNFTLTMGSSNTSNVIRDNSAMTFGDSCTSNTFGFYDNLTIPSGSEANFSHGQQGTNATFTSPLYGNTFEAQTLSGDFSAATHVYGFYSTRTYKRPDGTDKLIYYNDADVMVISDTID